MKIAPVNFNTNFGRQIRRDVDYDGLQSNNDKKRKFPVTPSILRKNTTSSNETKSNSFYSVQKPEKSKRTLENHKDLRYLKKQMTIQKYWYSEPLDEELSVEPPEMLKDAINLLIDHILVGKRNPLTKETPVEIHWNF